MLDFWFGKLDAEGLPDPAVSKRWFAGGPAFDREIEARFGADVRAALAGEREVWAETARGRLALILLLDQFTRNLFRGSAEAFAGDARALRHALAALADGQAEELARVERYFLYMPLEHAEDMALQERCVALFEALLAGCPDSGRRLFQGGVDYARRHRDAIARFGRFAARNAALDRPSTPEERAYLAEHPSGF